VVIILQSHILNKHDLKLSSCLNQNILCTLKLYKFSSWKKSLLKEIAAELEISITTVSKALKNYPDVSEKN
jgi:predicted transcriptional regulator